MKPHLEVSERYHNVGENVVFWCGLLAFPPSLHLIFGSATETVKETGPSPLVPCGLCPALPLTGPATFIMYETDNDDIDSSLLYLVSISRAEIITVPADPDPSTMDAEMNARRINEFLMRYLSAATSPMGTMNVQQYVNWMERIGGASGSDTDRDTAQTQEPWAVQYTDDTVMVHETDQDSMQDTDSTQIQDTNSAQTQETYSDQTQDTAQETKDTQDT